MLCKDETSRSQDLLTDDGSSENKDPDFFKEVNPDDDVRNSETFNLPNPAEDLRNIIMFLSVRLAPYIARRY